MPFKSMVAAQKFRRARRGRVARLDWMADKLDARFRIPGLGLRIGWDSIIGLVPGIGDFAMALPGIAVLYEAGRMGARRGAMLRIAANTGIDAVLGGIPVFGDIFDVLFKSHRRNVDILKQELDRIERHEKNEASWRNETAQRTDRGALRKPVARQSAGGSHTTTAHAPLKGPQDRRG